MKTFLLHLCLIATALAGVHADTFHTLPICPPDRPDFPKPIRPTIPLPPTADPWDQLAVNDQDGGCIRLPGKPTRPFPISTTIQPV